MPRRCAGDQVYAQAEATLVPLTSTSATAKWSVADTAGLQSDPAYTFLYDLTVGTHAITAVYIGDISNLGSTSAAVTQVCTLPEASSRQRRRALQLLQGRHHSINCTLFCERQPLTQCRC